MSNPTTSTVTISASADDVRAVLFDIEKYPTWSTTFKSVTVQASNGDGRVTQAKLSVDAGALKDKPTLNYDWSGYPDRVEFSLEDADLLEMMRTKAEKSTIDLALKQLKEKLEN